MWRASGPAIGKLLPDDLYVHNSALDSLEPILRIYEGCGRAYLGEVEGANIIKIHRRSGKLSYLVYPDFETDPHPALLSLRQAEPADAADRVLRVRPQRQPTGAAPQGDVPAPRRPAVRQVRPADGPRKRSTACWMSQAASARGRAGRGD